MDPTATMLAPYRAPLKPMPAIASRRTGGEGMIHRHACYAIITRTLQNPSPYTAGPYTAGGGHMLT